MHAEHHRPGGPVRGAPRLATVPFHDLLERRAVPRRLQQLALPFSNAGEMRGDLPAHLDAREATFRL